MHQTHTNQHPNARVGGNTTISPGHPAPTPSRILRSNQAATQAAHARNNHSRRVSAVSSVVESELPVIEEQVTDDVEQSTDSTDSSTSSSSSDSSDSVDEPADQPQQQSTSHTLRKGYHHYKWLCGAKEYEDDSKSQFQLNGKMAAELGTLGCTLKRHSRIQVAL